MFAAEVSSILELYDTTITVVYCDTSVANVEVFERQDLPLSIHPAGGGGTSYRPPFAYVDAHTLEPACMLYLTDGECDDFPDTVPFYPVLWITNKTHYRPPFGDVVNF